MLQPKEERNRAAHHQPTVKKTALVIVCWCISAHEMGKLHICAVFALFYQQSRNVWGHRGGQLQDFCQRDVAHSCLICHYFC